MDDVVPSFLQHFRAADILRVAGLAVASAGQEYCRVGAVQTTIRRGSQLLGTVDASLLVQHKSASRLNQAVNTEKAFPEQQCFEVSITVEHDASWTSYCSCSPGATLPCAHAAAVLYQWLAHPTTFFTSDQEREAAKLTGEQNETPMLPAIHAAQNTNNLLLLQSDQPTTLPIQSKPLVVIRGPTAFEDLSGLLSQIGLSDLRSMAREFELSTTGLNRQQLAEALAEMLNQPEAVRKVTSTLEKPQRQLLATIILAGGSVTDDELHGLFERFSFGKAEKLQTILLALQNKGLLFHTSMNGSAQQRIGLSGTLIDVGWHVPPGVRSALRVPVPITPFNIKQDADASEQDDELSLQRYEPSRLLADLLLMARVLEGSQLEQAGENSVHRSIRSTVPMRYSAGLSGGETSLIPSPAGFLSASFIERLQASVPRTPAFLRFAVRLLLLSGILFTDDTTTPVLRLLPNASQVLLGPDRLAAFRDLFELWLTQPAYDELFELQDEGLRLRCRTTPLNHPILRNGELEEENNEARQLLIALIAQAPLQQWIQFPPFARFIYRLHPLFLQKRQRLFSSPHWWLEQEEGRPLQPLQMADWMQAEGQYLVRMMRGPLHWWGCTDLALSKDGRLLAFRLTSVANWLFNGTDLSDVPQYDDHALSPLLEVGEDGALLILSHVAAWPLIELVEDFAEVAGVRAGRLCYRFTPRVLTDALGQGKDPSPLLALLQHIVANEKHLQHRQCLIDALAQIEQWTASYGRVRLYTGVSMLEVADMPVMRELKLTTSVEQHIVRPLSPTLYILKKQGIGQLTDDLKRRGQVPLLHEEEYDGTE